MKLQDRILTLTTGKQLSANDYEGLMSLATEMQKCMTTLGEIGYQSDLKSTQTNGRSVKYVKTLILLLNVKFSRKRQLKSKTSFKN